MLGASAADDLQRDNGVTYQPSPSVDDVPVNLMSVAPVDLEHFAVLCSRFMWCNSTAPIDTILHEVLSVTPLGNQVNTAQRRALELALHFGAELVRQRAVLVRQDLIAHFGHLHTVDPSSMLRYMVDHRWYGTGVLACPDQTYMTMSIRAPPLRMTLQTFMSSRTVMMAAMALIFDIV